MVYLKTSRNNNCPMYPSSCSNFDENTIGAANGVYMSIVLAEPTIYLNGLQKHEARELTPAMLRGSLIVRTTKPTKIKSINLEFKGTAKTEWPEGIPPAKVDISEHRTIYSHEWPFFDASMPTAEVSSGAHLVRMIKDSSSSSSSSSGGSAPSSQQAVDRKNMFKMRSTSPAPTTRRRNSGGNDSHDYSLAPNRSFSKQERQDHEVPAKKFRVFEPGEYIYNFELPLPHSTPETIKTNYGSVTYNLEASIQRAGAFKSNIVGSKEVELVRSTSFNDLESVEPINIEKKWESQMNYWITIAGKLFTIGTHIPMHFKFERINDDMKCHRIRVYLSENVEYYCRKRKVHRTEPTRRYMLKEQVSRDGLSGSLVGSQPSQFDFEVYIPKSFGSNHRDLLHPNSTFDNIKVHHWVKIVLRLSKVDNNKRKYFEISIDSPISLLHKNCVQKNLELPKYTRPSLARNPSSVGIPLHFERTPSTAFIQPPPYPQSPPAYDQTLTEIDENHSHDSDISSNSMPSSQPPPSGPLEAEPSPFEQQFSQFTLNNSNRPNSVHTDDSVAPPSLSGVSEASQSPAESLLDLPVETAKHVTRHDDTTTTNNSNSHQMPQPQVCAP